MKKLPLVLLLVLLLSMFAGCSQDPPDAQVVATTMPVFQFTQHLCQGTDIKVTQLITESVSCLHNYTLQVSQMRTAEAADMVILSGVGMEDFLNDCIANTETVVDSSVDVPLLSGSDGHHHGHHNEHHSHHHHEHDPHIWLSPSNAKIMSRNICNALSVRFPEHAETLEKNLQSLIQKLDVLQAYGDRELADLKCRDLITFHDGFSYFAESFGLTILESIEEESGSEASARELKHLINLVNEHHIPAIFVERNGSASAASVISRETGARVFTLDMAMSGNDYFSAIYHNIDTVREAMG